MPIYNCKHSGDQYSITKFNRHGEVESSYLCDHVQCQCPAGVRDTCRHRLMLPAFLEHGLVNTNLFLDWDNGRRIVDFNGLPAPVQSNEESEPYGISPLITSGGLDAVKADNERMKTEIIARETPTVDLAPQALTDTCAQTNPLEPTDILSPSDVHSSYDLSVDMFTKDVTPASPSITPTTPQWRRW